MIIKTFLHIAGSKQTPIHSEYEIDKNGITKILAVHNAVLIDEFIIKVIDEKKPVLFIMDSVVHESIWRLDGHMKRDSGNYNAGQVLSGDVGFMIFSHIRNRTPQFIKIRIEEETYYAGETPDLEGELNIISYEDLLELTSGEITWKNLKGRSYLHRRYIEKEKSSWEKCVQLASELQREKDSSEELNYTITNLGKKIQDLEANTLKLTRIPTFVKWFFSAI